MYGQSVTLLRRIGFGGGGWEFDEVKWFVCVVYMFGVVRCRSDMSVGGVRSEGVVWEGVKR